MKKSIIASAAVALMMSVSLGAMAAEQPDAKFEHACEKILAHASVTLKALPFEVLPVIQKSLAEISANVADAKLGNAKAPLSYNQATRSA